jgi:hypothetical protein
MPILSTFVRLGQAAFAEKELRIIAIVVTAVVVFIVTSSWLFLLQKKHPT